MKKILDNSPLCLALGKTPSLKILSFLMAHADFDYTKTELAKNSGLSRGTIYVGLKPLIKYNIVIVSRKIGNTTLYKLNIRSAAVAAIYQINECIVEQIAEEELATSGVSK